MRNLMKSLSRDVVYGSSWKVRCAKESRHNIITYYYLQMKTRREIQKEKMLGKYKRVFDMAQEGVSWGDIAATCEIKNGKATRGYKNGKSVRSHYYSTILKLFT